jgi:hypothetical protein
MTNRVARSFALCGSIAGIAAALLMTTSLARGAPPDKPCLLLTDAEITATIGAPGKSHEGQKAITEGPAKGETMRTCSWAIANAGGAVNLSVVKVNDLETAKSAFRAQMQQSMQSLKSHGWTIEEKAFGSDMSCWAGTPPAGHDDMPRATGCVGATHGMGISVLTSGSSKAEIEGVKKLLDAAMKRLG